MSSPRWRIVGFEGDEGLDGVEGRGSLGGRDVSRRPASRVGGEVDILGGGGGELKCLVSMGCVLKANAGMSNTNNSSFFSTFSLLFLSPFLSLV